MPTKYPQNLLFLIPLFPLSTSTLPSTSSSPLPAYPTQQNRTKNITLPFSPTSSRIFFSFLEISATLSLSLFLSFALKNLSFSLQFSHPLVEEPKRERERKMASFSEAPPGDPKVGEKMFKTKCAQCHTVDKGAGHKQGPNLNGLFGRQFGTTLGTPIELLTRTWLLIGRKRHCMIYLLNPKKYILGIKMVFPRLKMPQDQADLIS